jgi:predicted signal transduction protein with EAL and GGDEF domain
MKVSATVGMAIFPDDAIQAEELLAKAEPAQDSGSRRHAISRGDHRARQAQTA